MFANALTINGASLPSNNDSEILGPIRVETAVAEAPRQETVEQLVREYFKDTPDLIAVAWCESRFRQYDSNGSVHRGQVNSEDIGVMQINTLYHIEDAKAHDMDIFTVEGNMAYAKRLYSQEGLQPWSASKPCWKKYIGTDQGHVAYVEQL